MMSGGAQDMRQLSREEIKTWVTLYPIYFNNEFS